MSKKKSEIVIFRTTLDDKQRLQAKALEADLTLAELVRDYILNDKTEIIHKEDSVAIIYQLNKIGNNVNQLAKRANYDHLAGKISDVTYAKVITNLKIYSAEVNALFNLIKLKG